MRETETPRKGPVEGTSRILRELLRTPAFKKAVNVVLSDLDPQNAGLLAQALVWEDVGFFLSTMNSLPSALNVSIKFTQELVRQLGYFPPELISGFIAAIIGGLDAEGLGEGVGLLVMLMLEMRATDSAELKKAGPEFVEKFSRGLAGALDTGAGEGRSAGAVVVEKLVPVMSDMASRAGESAAEKGSKTNELVKSISEGIQKVSSDNPRFMDSVVSPLLESWRKAVKGPAKAKAARKPAKTARKPAKGKGKTSSGK